MLKRADKMNAPIQITWVMDKGSCSTEIHLTIDGVTSLKHARSFYGREGSMPILRRYAQAFSWPPAAAFLNHLIAAL